MIISSGQILTGKASEDLDKIVEVRTRADGFHYSVYKALALPATMPTTPSNVNGTWVKMATTGDDDRFVGVCGDDTSPQANIILSSGKPALDLYESYSVKQGGVLTFERNAVLNVIADGVIKEGDFLELGANGAFKKQATTDRSKAVGRAYQNAADKEPFIAYIQAL